MNYWQCEFCLIKVVDKTGELPEGWVVITTTKDEDYEREYIACESCSMDYVDPDDVLVLE